MTLTPYNVEKVVVLGRPPSHRVSAVTPRIVHQLLEERDAGVCMSAALRAALHLNDTLAVGPLNNADHLLGSLLGGGSEPRSRVL